MKADFRRRVIRFVVILLAGGLLEFVNARTGAGNEYSTAGGSSTAHVQSFSQPFDFYETKQYGNWADYHSTVDDPPLTANFSWGGILVSGPLDAQLDLTSSYIQDYYNNGQYVTPEGVVEWLQSWQTSGPIQFDGVLLPGDSLSISGQLRINAGTALYAGLSLSATVNDAGPFHISSEPFATPLVNTFDWTVISQLSVHLLHAASVTALEDSAGGDDASFVVTSWPFETTTLVVPEPSCISMGVIALACLNIARLLENGQSRAALRASAAD